MNVHGTNQFGLWPSLFFSKDMLHWAYQINMVTNFKEILQKFSKRDERYNEFRCQLLEIGFVENHCFHNWKWKEDNPIDTLAYTVIFPSSRTNNLLLLKVIP